MLFSIFSEHAAAPSSKKEEEEQAKNEFKHVRCDRMHTVPKVKNVAIDKSVFDMIYNSNVSLKSLPFIVFNGIKQRV